MLAVITGASAGVGRATARQFAARGYDVAIVARNEARLLAAAADCAEAGVVAQATAAPLGGAGAVEAAAERIDAELGPIDIWVNNAMVTVFRRSSS